MSKSEQRSFSSVLSVNPYKENYFKGISSFISEEKSPEFSKEQLVISYLNTKEFITAQIEISKNIPEEDVFDALSNKAYDELALDQAVEYKIQYIESFNNLDEENRHFHVFIVDPLDVTNTFSPVVDKIKYIDVIIPVPLLIKSLYTKEIIDGSGVHCYIYFQENDAFLTLYSEKDFLYTKSIKYSFIDMHERFCELYGERIDYHEFLNFFTQTNLKETDSEYKSYIIKLYKELFANINDILTYTKRAFEIDKIDHIYIGSQTQTVTELHEMIEAELNIPSSQFNFDYGFENNEYVDQLHALMHLYSNLSNENKYRCNFTDYRRPPRFIERDSGRLITVIAASLALAFAYPITYWVLTYAQALQEDLLQQKYKELHNTRVTREATIKNRLADKDKSMQLLTKEETEYNDKKNTLIKIHQVKVDYPMKAKLLALFAKEMSKYDVKATRTSYSEETKDKKVLTIYLASKRDRQTTELVEHLTKVYEGKYTFELEKIMLDDSSKMYLSELKVKLP
ncbi:hypothetical protein [Sulfurimonas sp. C5]|uniref:hypothetical protein n=1 Tax=Sulfurimonas sp. C5 TaxID=3036947 RepID=UPI0024589A03|nr:hypothetical protein [Sulfurimonas sp. C5]MDH4943550.1 hypothetical protein [Sulfurimonas sp. C5]